MLLRIEITGPRRLVGQRRTISLAANTTPELWRSFMQRRGELPASGRRYSLQIYPPAYFKYFSAEVLFEKWATLEVTDPAFALPNDFETLVLAGGLYAVFLHKGPASEGAKTFRHIIRTWLPDSGYVLDDRPHFEELGEKYQNDSPHSAEEIWLPIKPR